MGEELALSYIRLVVLTALWQEGLKWEGGSGDKRMPNAL